MLGRSPCRPLFSLPLACFLLPVFPGGLSQGCWPRADSKLGALPLIPALGCWMELPPRLGKGSSLGTPLWCRGGPTCRHAALRAAAEAAPGMLQAPAMVLLQTGACSALGRAWEKSPRLMLCFPAAASALPGGTLPQPGLCCCYVSLLVSGELGAKTPGPALPSASSASGCSCAPCTALTSSPHYLQFP